MAIPPLWDLTLPVLKRLSHGRCTTDQIVEAMAAHFRLSEEERRRRSAKRGIIEFDNRIHWVLGAALGDAGLVKRVSPRSEEGVYEITSSGREVVAHPPQRIDHEYLRRFAEYDSKYSKRTDRSGSTAQNTNSIAAPTSVFKPGSQKARILQLMQRENGVSEPEVCTELGWVQAGATIGRTIQAASGQFEISKIKGPDGLTRYLARERVPEEQSLPPMERLSSYGIEDVIADGCFLPREKIEAALALLKRKKNLVLQGPPGTGKTWLAKRLGYALLGAKERDRVLSVQFQPSLSYEDFVRGWRFSGGQFALVDGVFLEAAETARESSEPFVLVIEEINRGNPAQILGDLLTLIEADKRDPSEAIRLSYVRDQEECFFIPPNLYIVGTMNVADRSLALVDFALRRRFAFVDLEPQLGQEWAKWCRRAGAPTALVANVQQRLDELNNNIASDKSLGRQFCIGHSFVTPAPGEPARDWHAWFKSVAESEIAPLLREYWYDNASMADKEINKLLAGL
jgi:MoxR-like ATPase